MNFPTNRLSVFSNVCKNSFKLLPSKARAFNCPCMDICEDSDVEPYSFSRRGIITLAFPLQIPLIDLKNSIGSPDILKLNKLKISSS